MDDLLSSDWDMVWGHDEARGLPTWPNLIRAFSEAAHVRPGALSVDPPFEVIEYECRELTDKMYQSLRRAMEATFFDPPTREPFRCVRRFAEPRTVVLPPTWAPSVELER